MINGFRSTLATFAIRTARSFGRQLGCEVVVEVSDHSLGVSMDVPDKHRRAWDPRMYQSGQMYIKGYANPVKPTVDYHKELENPDTADVEQAEVQGIEGSHVSMISSPRYREYMRQSLISELLNPREQWKLIAYAVIGLAILMAANLMFNIASAGIF